LINLDGSDAITDHQISMKVPGSAEEPHKAVLLSLRILEAKDSSTAKINFEAQVIPEPRVEPDLAAELTKQV
jgi:hypothetical protein